MTSAAGGGGGGGGAAAAVGRFEHACVLWAQNAAHHSHHGMSRNLQASMMWLVRPHCKQPRCVDGMHGCGTRARAGAGAERTPLAETPAAAAALEAGACMVNDVWGLRRDPKMGGVVAVHRAWIVLMHQRAGGVPQGDAHLGFRYVDAQHTQVLEEVESDLRTSIALAHAAGVHDDRILLDPGIGFGKTVEQNLLLVNCLERIKAMGYPVLLGVSRKSFLGYTLGCTPQERLEGTSAAVSIGIARGADMVRVHDVEAMSRVVRMSDALVRQTERLSFG